MAISTCLSSMCITCAIDAIISRIAFYSHLWCVTVWIWVRLLIHCNHRFVRGKIGPAQVLVSPAICFLCALLLSHSFFVRRVFDVSLPRTLLQSHFVFGYR